jgi:hypothetical protein
MSYQCPAYVYILYVCVAGFEQIHLKTLSVCVCTCMCVCIHHIRYISELVSLSQKVTCINRRDDRLSTCSLYDRA